MRKPYKILAFFLIIFLTGCVPKSYHIGNTNAGFSAADSVPFLPPLQSREAVPFGAKRGGATLDGIIFYAREGEPVVAARSGRVVFVGEGFIAQLNCQHQPWIMFQSFNKFILLVDIKCY